MTAWKKFCMRKSCYPSAIQIGQEREKPAVSEGKNQSWEKLYSNTKDRLLRKHTIVLGENKISKRSETKM